MGLKVGCFVGFLHQPEENLPIQKSYTDKNRLVNEYKYVIKETGSKAGCLAGF